MDQNIKSCGNLTQCLQKLWEVFVLVAELQPLLRGDVDFVDHLSLQQRSAVPEHTDGSSQKPDEGLHPVVAAAAPQLPG